MTVTRYVSTLLFISLLGGCASQIDPALEKQRQLQIQRMQTKVYDTHDKKVILRGVIATLQDLSFDIKNADIEQGIVSAKRYGTYPIEMTVTVRFISKFQTLVQGIAQYKRETIEDPFLYEQFFSSLQTYLPPALHSRN